MEPPDALRFCADAERVPEELRLDEPEERLPDVPAATAAADALRSPEKRSVPFAADRGSSALRDVGMGVETVFGCGRGAPVLAIVVIILYYNKE